MITTTAGIGAGSRASFTGLIPASGETESGQVGPNFTGVKLEAARELTQGHAGLSPTSACGAVFDTFGRVLVIRRADDGRWALPGGLIEPGESADRAMVREVWEETGVLVAPVRLSGFYTAGLRRCLTFLARPHGGALVTTSEATAVAWLPTADAAERLHAGDVILGADQVPYAPRLTHALALHTRTTQEVSR